MKTFGLFRCISVQNFSRPSRTYEFYMHTDTANPHENPLAKAFSSHITIATDDPEMQFDIDEEYYFMIRQKDEVTL